MPSIDARTGLLFTDEQVNAGEDLRQSVEDRILTLPGSRSLRPGYGSVAPNFIRPLEITAQSIRNSLFGDSRIVSVNYRFDGDTMIVDINGRLKMRVNV